MTPSTITSSTCPTRCRMAHRVAVPEPERGKHTGAGVGDERRVKVAQSAAAEIDAGEHERRHERAPSRGASDVGARGSSQRESIVSRERTRASCGRLYSRKGTP